MKFKVGERVKRIIDESDILRIGDIGKVIKVFSDYGAYRVINERSGKEQTWAEDYIERYQENQSVVIYRKENETVAKFKEGNKVIKTATAKCSPNDAYNFETGAKLAFERLVDIKPEVESIEAVHKGVHRLAKAGEWVKVTNDGGHNAKVGMIGKVISLGRDHSGWVRIRTNDGFSSSLIRDDQYVVLENYQPDKPPKTPLSEYTIQEISDELLRRYGDVK